MARPDSAELGTSLETDKVTESGYPDPAFSTLAKDLASITHPARHEDDQETTQTAWKRRHAVEKFILTRTGTSDTIPWLEPRSYPPRLDLPTCHSLPLPPHYQRHLNDENATVGLFPFAPPIEFLQDLPPELYDLPHGDETYTFENHVLYQLQEHGLNLLHNIGDSNPSYQEAVSRIGGWERIANAHATWAKAGTIDGVDFMRSRDRLDSLTEIFHSGDLTPHIKTESGVKMQDTVLLPMPLDMEQVVRNANTSLKELFDDIASNIDNPVSHPIFDYRERSSDTFLSFRNIVDVCRWYLDHNLSDKELRPKIINILQDAYLGYNTVLQTCQANDYGGLNFWDAHDISTLIAGPKIDQYNKGRIGQEVVPNFHADYLDAFMAVSQFRQVAQAYLPAVVHGASLRWGAHEGYRPLFNDFATANDTLRQQLVVMDIMYLRMPKWQKEAYQELIWEQFGTIEAELAVHPNKSAKNEPPLFIPSAPTPKYTRNPDIHPCDFTSAKDIVAFMHINPLYWFTKSQGEDFMQKRDAHLEVPLQGATDVVGLGSHEYWVDELGFVHPGFEPRRSVTTSAIEITREKPKNWLEKIQAIPTLLPESRLGKKAAETITELLRRDQETGSVRTVSKFSAMLERLLGRKPTGEEADFVSLLQELSLINTESLTLNELSPDDLQDTLKRIREGKANLSDLDEGSLIMLLLATSGSIPRELLVELVFKSYESAGSVLTLEAITALENLDEKRRFSLFGINKKKPSLILSGKASLEELIQAHKEDPEYNPLIDPIWQAQAKELISKVTTLLKTNKTYDVTMRSPLIAVLAAKEDEQLVARCAVDGELLTAILKFMSPQLPTYFAQTYGPEANKSIPDWYEWLSTATESGDQSHAFNQTKWPNHSGMPSLTVADATGGFIYPLSPDELLWPAAQNELVQFGDFSDQDSAHIFFGKRRALGSCVTGGSHLLSTLAQEADELEYAELANPDSPQVLTSIIWEESLDIERRAIALDKLLVLEPQILAMATKADFSRGSTVQKLEKVVDLGRKTGRWGGAFFAANILRRAGFFTPEIREQGEQIHALLASSLAAESQTAYDEALLNNQDFIFPEDHLAIEEARTKYLEELAAKAREEKKRQDEIEREFRQAEMARLNIEIEVAATTVRTQGSQLAIEDAKQQHEKEKNSPTLGVIATRQKKSELTARETEITNSTVATPSSNPALPDSVFETIQPQVSQRALIAATTGKDGKRLTGQALDLQLRRIQQVIVKVAHDLTVKQLGSGQAERGDATLTHPHHVKREVIRMAEALHSGFSANATTLGLTVPTFDPRSELSSLSTRQLTTGSD